MIGRAGLTRWPADYVAAWRSRDRERISVLFADAAHYRYQPHEQPIVGSRRIADVWLEIDDPPGSGVVRRAARARRRVESRADD